MASASASVGFAVPPIVAVRKLKKSHQNPYKARIVIEGYMERKDIMLRIATPITVKSLLTFLAQYLGVAESRMILTVNQEKMDDPEHLLLTKGTDWGTYVFFLHMKRDPDAVPEPIEDVDSLEDPHQNPFKVILHTQFIDDLYFRISEPITTRAFLNYLSDFLDIPEDVIFLRDAEGENFDPDYELMSSETHDVYEYFLKIIGDSSGDEYEIGSTRYPETDGSKSESVAEAESEADESDSDEGDKVQVFVQDINGKTAQVWIDPSRTDVVALFEKLGYGTEEIANTRAIFAGKQFVPTTMLSEYGVIAESTIKLTGRLKGRGRKEAANLRLVQQVELRGLKELKRTTKLALAMASTEDDRKAIMAQFDKDRMELHSISNGSHVRATPVKDRLAAKVAARASSSSTQG